MKISHKSLLLLIPALLFSLLSCKKEFKVKGEISGASKALVVLEKADFNGRWLIVDSTRTSGSGNFSMSRPALAAPEIFRLSFDGRYIYFPVDSTETVSVKTTSQDFGTRYDLGGSSDAAVMAAFDMDIISLPANSVPDSLDDFKKTVYTKYIQPSPSSIVSYYILTKEIDGKPLFRPDRSPDYRYFGAVATGFRDLRPDDPRTSLLTQTTVSAMKRRNSEKGSYQQIEAQELSLLDITLPNEKGENVKLSDIAGKGKPVVLVFSLMTTDDAPLINYELSQLREKRGGNIDIYQVSLDPDRYAWREAASNLPWVTVYDSDGAYSSYAATYTVIDLPAFFIYNAGGELTDRAFSIDELKSKL